MKDHNEILITDEILARYLAGESTPEEAMVLHDWLEVDENRTRFDAFRKMWDISYPSKKFPHIDKKIAWKNIRDSMPVQPDDAARLSIRPARGMSFFLKVAATALILAIAGIFAYLKLGVRHVEMVSVVSTDSTRQLVLPDESRAVLNQHSKITFSKNFSGRTRAVHLSGEAFFKVTHDKAKPFIVHTDIANVQVVGTAFNVAAVGDKLDVSVAEGKVLVYTSGDSVYLVPGQALTIHSDKRVNADQQKNANSNDWGYATKKFEFKNALLSEVFACIEKSYPYSIKVQNDAIKNCKLTATFDNASAEYIVTLIAETLDLTVTKKGNVFYLEGKGCR